MHIFGLQSRISLTPLSRSGQSVNQPVCKLEVGVNPPEDIALHHHVKVIHFAYFLSPSPSNTSYMNYMRPSDIYWYEITKCSLTKNTWKPITHNLSSCNVRPDRGEEKLGPFPPYPIVVLRTADATEWKNTIIILLLMRSNFKGGHEFIYWLLSHVRHNRIS